MSAREGKVTCDLSISLDGYSAGLNQSEDRPFGDDGADGWGSKLHAWMEDPEEQRLQLDRLTETKAFIMGRNMFGPVRAFKQAREAAGDGNISIHGGATTINQYLAAGLIDELRLRIVPITLGAGTRLFDGVGQMNLEQVESRAADSFTHVTYRVVPA